MITSDGSPASHLSVEFIDAQNEDFNIHTATDSNGHYSARLPPGVYHALTEPITGTVTNQADNEVYVPPSRTIDFRLMPDPSDDTSTDGENTTGQTTPTTGGSTTTTAAASDG